MMRWAQRGSQERLNHIGQYIAMTPTLQSAIGAVRSHYEAWRTQPEGSCLFLIGESRVGKTAALDEFVEELHKQLSFAYAVKKGYEVKDLDPLTASTAITIVTPTGLERPIIKVLVGSRPTFNEPLAHVLLYLGVPVASRVTFGERLQLLTTQLTGQKVHMVVFDEVQHISEHRSAEGAYRAADVFKVLMKATRVQIVCAGLPHTLEIMDANPQIAGLTHQIHHVRPFAFDLDHASELMRFMQAINQELPFDEISTMAEPDVALRVGLYTDFCAGRIALLTHAAVGYAIERNRRCIDIKVLAETLRERFCVPDTENVFKMCSDALKGYSDLIRQRRQERLSAAEHRQTKSARHKRHRSSFGARGR
jgi:AAA domain